MSSKYTDKLKDKQVLVIGGTSGIGFCVAEACIEHGAHVVVASSKQSKIEKTIERIVEAYPDAKGRIRGHPCDLSKGDVEANIRSLFEFASNKGQYKIDHVVLTAGNTPPEVRLDNATPDTIMELGKVWFIGGILVAKVATGYIKETVESSFTLTGGIQTHRPLPGRAVMVGFGAALEGLTRGLALDMRPVRVNLVEPGAVLTERLENYASKTNLEAIVKHFKEKAITNSLGTPAELAESYVYLMKNTFATGTILSVEGGALTR